MGTLVMAAVSVVLPWSTWPMVPTFMCGLVRELMSYSQKPRRATAKGLGAQLLLLLLELRTPLLAALECKDREG